MSRDMAATWRKSCDMARHVANAAAMSRDNAAPE
jgi:hypothetical protein